MKTLARIPFSIDADRIMAHARVEPGSDDAAELLSLVQLAREIGSPKAAYTPCFVTQRNGDGVRIEDVWFSSRTLAHKLESVERVFALVATCGHELERQFPEEENMLHAFWWDLIKTCLLDQANEFLYRHLHKKFRLGKTATMRPGAGDVSVWPIEQQKGLFGLLDGVEAKIGVRLTDSFLMIPTKTTSGILFPTETDFRSCEVCHRENCPSRHAHFNKELWEEVQT